MVRLVNAKQAQDLDYRTQKEFSVRGEDLMETAGRLSADVFQKIFPKTKTSLAVICGPGNNAGDGLVMARELRDRGYTKIKVYCLFEPGDFSPLLKTQIEKFGASHIISLADDRSFERCAAHDVFIDAVFGVGLSRDIDGELAAFFEELSLRYVISLDIPSGLDATTGDVRGTAIRAQHTLAYGQPKAGCLIRQGPAKSGQLIQLDIGFPKKLRDEIANSHFLIRLADVARHLPERTALGNKSKYGHVKVWAGHEGMWGACVLAARAAYRTGAGYVTVPENSITLDALPEALSEKDYSVDPDAVYAVGPGWGVTEENRKNLIKLYEAGAPHVVLDADALTLIVKYNLLVRPSWILTPHTGEMSRLMNNVASEVIEKDRFAWALKAATKWKCTILLKGYRSLVARQGKVFVVPTGNAGLSKAGSGDVLTGMIAGLMAQGLDPLKATVCGAYVHGRMADEWILKRDMTGLTPSDLLTEIPAAMSAVKSLKKLKR